MRTRRVVALFIVFAISGTLTAQNKKSKNQEKEEPTYKSSSFSGLKFRSLGPGFKSGRIADIAVNEKNPFEYYVAVASGGVWKTQNAGNTYRPIFDNQGSYSIGCVTISPNNPHIVWVGTGENNNQRSVAYGDGVYKSLDGGKTWKNMGLKESEHIGKIVVDPNDDNIVYVAAYGPLWSSGGERGVYKTYDGGISWQKVLDISENTGVSDLVMDPRNSKVMYAVAHQRRRHVFTYIDGGPESAIYKTIDGGETWDKLENGIPKNDKGRIGLAISPANPDVVYAIIKATENGGFYRSVNRGGSFEKMSKRQTSGNYYQELYCDPKDVDRVFSMDTWLYHTEDGGKTFVRTGEDKKHVDNHAMWIDPKNTDHWLVGCDGGIYETWDGAKSWHYKPNLPVTQFYRVSVDNDYPFYNMYGGTQDNNTIGGPVATINTEGIVNADWSIVKAGDGFKAQVDPKNPDILYVQSQYGWLNRFDLKSGQPTGIQPQPAVGEDAYRWNWDPPLLISPHNHKRLYFCANKVFKSDDRGNTWQTISPDLTQQIDRNKLKVMGRVWGIDAVQKNGSTSIYGNIVAFDESPKQEGLLYVGTDDGLIQVSEDDGKNWRKIESFPGIPNNTYVNAVVASQHDASTVYAVFNNHKNGDFKPYVLKSSNKGASWVNITGNLPERGSVYALQQDHESSNLLFAGTEFGFFFSLNEGKEWTKLGAGLPTVAIRDIAMQRRENDIVLASFGRGLYVLDNYAPLREVSEEMLGKEAHLFKVKKALSHVKAMPLGVGGGGQGHSFYMAPNPPNGSVFTYFLKDKIETIKEARQKKESELRKEGKDVFYPSFEEIRAEDKEEKPYLLFVVEDAAGNPIRKIKTGVSPGINRVVWDHKYTTTVPVRLKPRKVGRYGSPDEGFLAMPGRYKVQMFKNVNGEFTALSEKVEFEVEALNNVTLPAEDKAAWKKFHEEMAELVRSVTGGSKLLVETRDKLKYVKAAVVQYPNVPLELMKKVKEQEVQLNELEIAMWGDQKIARLEFETKPSIVGRLSTVSWHLAKTTSAPTSQHHRDLKAIRTEFQPALTKLKGVIQKIELLEEELLKLKAPYTPNRGTNWNKE